MFVLNVAGFILRYLFINVLIYSNFVWSFDKFVMMFNLDSD